MFDISSRQSGGMLSFLVVWPPYLDVSEMKRQ